MPRLLWHGLLTMPRLLTEGLLFEALTPGGNLRSGPVARSGDHATTTQTMPQLRETHHSPLLLVLIGPQKRHEHAHLRPQVGPLLVGRHVHRDAHRHRPLAAVGDR